MGASSNELAARLPALAVRACDSVDDPSLLALTIELHRRVGATFPPSVLTRLRGHLLKTRHPTWSADALGYLKADDSADAAPVFDARVMDAWTGAADDPALLHLGNLPAPLKWLLEIDRDSNPEQRVVKLEKPVDAAGLEDPRKTWHRLGIARRLANSYEALSDRDSVRFPFSKCLPHAIVVVELDPKDVDARVRALRGLVYSGEFEKADVLAKPAVHDLRVALLAGIARARLGKTEEAAALLRPVVERDFQQFVKATEAWHRTYQSLSRELWGRLERGDDQKLVKWLNSLPQAESAAEAQKWVNRFLSGDAHLSGLRKAVEELADVQAAAHELAMIELALGRAAPPGPARAARLEAAEKLFRDLRRTSPDDAEQELALAQVCVWLGKEAESAEIFERHTKAGQYKVLHQMGRIYRELGRLDAARDVLEKAYETAPPDEKSGIASVRSLASNTYDDKLAWLEKCNSSEPYIRNEIEEARSHMALERGDFDAATVAIKRVAAYYASLPEDATTLNNAALNLQALASASGLGPLTDAEL
jgi:tetratricopeptide (TPR) repeat protein